MPSQMLGTPWCSHSMSPNPQDTGKDVDVGCWRIRDGWDMSRPCRLGAQSLVDRLDLNT